MRLVSATLLVAAAWLGGLVLLVAAGEARPAVALALAAFGTVATALLVRPMLAALRALRRNLAGLAEDPAAPLAAVPRSPFVEDTAAAVARLACALAERRQSGEAALQSAA